MKNPTMFYKAPGPYDIHGGHFDYTIIDADEDGAVEQALADGWFATTTEAKEARAEASLREAALNAPATRAELEAKATELGIKFTDRTSDKKLGDLIAANLEE
jgi:hypothetical protein